MKLMQGKRIQNLRTGSEIAFFGRRCIGRPRAG